MSLVRRKRRQRLQITGIAAKHWQASMTPFLRIFGQFKERHDGTFSPRFLSSAYADVWDNEDLTMPVRLSLNTFS